MSTVMEFSTRLRHVLVLEDDFLIALETEFILNGLGAENIHIAANATDALVVAASVPLDFALLDVQLRDGTCFDVAVFLMENGIPFGFCSGYGDNISAPETLMHVPKVSKPFDSEAIAVIVRRALTGRQ